MVRNQGGDRSLSVKIPSFFRCPISLDVMKSPVSLCTGVTYDRASIQRWLESGNTTCPATMQPLNTTDLVPNLTLQRLINLWAQSGPSRPHPARPLLSEIRSAADPSPALRKLAAFFDDEGVDEYDKSQLINGDLAQLLASILADNLARLETLEEALGLISRILIRNKKIMTSALSLRLDESTPSLIRVLKEGRDPRSQANAAAAIDSLLARNPESAAAIAEKHDVIPLLTLLIEKHKSDGGGSIAAINAGLSCLVRLSGTKRIRIRMIRSGIVPVITRILSAETVPAAAAEKAMKLMEAASSCRDGREAICEDAGAAISAVLKRMMKVGREGTEAAVVVLWSTCHLFRDRRAQEAVEVNGGLTRVLLLMQSDCSPAVREMAGDLLRMFRVGKKCCLVGYDTKTTHIMPF